MGLLVKTLFAVAGLALLIKAILAVEKSAKIELRSQAEGPFLNTLKQHNIREYDLLHEQLVPGAKGRMNKLFEVHRVISDRDGPWRPSATTDPSPRPTRRSCSKGRKTVRSYPPPMHQPAPSLRMGVHGG